MYDILLALNPSATKAEAVAFFMDAYEDAETLTEIDFVRAAKKNNFMAYVCVCGGGSCGSAISKGLYLRLDVVGCVHRSCTNSGYIVG